MTCQEAIGKIFKAKAQFNDGKVRFFHQKDAFITVFLDKNDTFLVLEMSDHQNGKILYKEQILTFFFDYYYTENFFTFFEEVVCE